MSAGLGRQEFDDLARRLAERFEGRPEALRSHAARWAWLGLAGVAAWCLTLLAAGAAAIVGGVLLTGGWGIALLVAGALALAAGIFQTVLFLAPRFNELEGRKLAPDEAPALRAKLEELRQRLTAPPLDEIRVTLDFNASVALIPGGGWFGGRRHGLTLGLPLLAALAPDEFDAVLAHELAHVSARHPADGRLVARLHAAWTRLGEKLSKPADGTAGRWLRTGAAAFAKWYWPRFDARARLLSRVQEFAADRLAAEATSGRALRDALWRLGCCDLRAGRFWERLRESAATRPEPPTDVLAEQRAALAAAPDPAEAQRDADAVRRAVTDALNSHPAFAERAAALGETPAELATRVSWGPAEPSAAEAYFGTLLPELAAERGEDWLRRNRAAWRERHRRGQAAAPPPPADLTAGDTHGLWRQAVRAGELHGWTAVEPTLAELAGRGHAGARTLLGGVLLERAPEAGAALLEAVLAEDHDEWTPQAGALLEEHFRNAGAADRLHAVRRRLDAFDAERVAAAKERSELTLWDVFLPHGLEGDALARLQAALAKQPDCATAWLARKRVRHFPGRALFVLCSTAGKKADDDRRLAQRLLMAAPAPGQLMSVPQQGGDRELARRIVAAGPPVHQRAPG